MLYTAPLSHLLPVIVPPVIRTLPPSLKIAAPLAVVLLLVRVTPVVREKFAPAATWTREPSAAEPSVTDPSTVSVPTVVSVSVASYLAI